MAIQMRRGQLANYDKSKMLPGEWGISIDNDSDNQKAFISFAPGVSKEVMMVEDAEEQIAEATSEAIDMATEEAEAWAHGNSFHVNNYASGDGSTRTFTLAETPSSIIGVYVDGSSVSAYTLSGKTITFTTAPASGSNNIRVYYTVDTTTDNAKYYKEQAEEVAESIPEDYSDLSDDVAQLKNALTTKAEQDGAYPDLTAGQMLSKNETSDSVPYNFRALGQDSTLEYTDAIVGGSVAWNQLIQNGNFANANGWAFNFGTIVVANNELTFTSDGSNVVGATYRNAVFASNHKVLVSFEAKGDFPHVRLRRPFQSVGTVLGSTYRTYSFVGNVNGQDQVNLETVMIQGVLDTAEAGKTYSLKNVCAFDLTQMLGTTIADYIYTLETATEGAGVTWLRKHFPKIFNGDYIPYNAGEIVSVQGLSQHVTTGFNQWDEVVELGTINSNGVEQASSTLIRTKNYIPVIPNTRYYMNTAKFNTVIGYDANKNWVASNFYINVGDGGYYIDVPNGVHYIRVPFADTYGTTYNHDICINLSDPTRNGEYEPYQKRTYPLDSTKTFRGIFKLDSNNQLYADGDRYLPDGTVQRRYGVVDLGTLDWSYFGSSGHEKLYSNGLTNVIMPNTNPAVIVNIVNQKYVVASPNDIYTHESNKIIAINQKNIEVYDTDYTDAATFKTAMSGVYLVYELATSTTETADPYTVPQIVDPDGTEEYVSTSIVPVGHESRYPLDIAGRLDKILTMPTANGTYTLRATVNNGAVTYAWVST